MTLEDIKEKILFNKEILQKEFQVHEIGVFGSYTRNEQNAQSDVDVLVEFDEPVSLLEIIKLENYLSEILKVKVDVIPKKDLRPELKKNILNEVVLI